MLNSTIKYVLYIYIYPSKITKHIHVISQLNSYKGKQSIRRFKEIKKTTNIVAFIADNPPTIYHFTLIDDVCDLKVCNQMFKLVTSLTDVFRAAHKTVYCGCLCYLTILFQMWKFHSAERDTKIKMCDNFYTAVSCLFKI